MMPANLKAGMIVVTEGGNGFIGRAIKWFTKSRWSHTFMILDEHYGVEAWFPDGVREFRLDERFEELEREGRDYVVLDHPSHDDLTRDAVHGTALQYMGRKYDVMQIVYYVFFRRFIDDGPLRVICSRMETAIYKDALGWDLFTPESFIKHGTLESRRWQLEQGWSTPGEMLSDSVLEPVQTADIADLQDFEDAYEDEALYAQVSAEHQILTTSTQA